MSTFQGVFSQGKKCTRNAMGHIVVLIIKNLLSILETTKKTYGQDACDRKPYKKNAEIAIEISTDIICHVLFLA